MVRRRSTLRRRRVARKPFASRVKNVLNRNRERKQWLNSNQDITIPVASSGNMSWAHVTDIATGDNHDERIGDKVSLSSVQFRVGFNTDVATMTDYDSIRMIVIQARNVATPTTSTVLEDDDAFHSPRDVTSRNRWKILYDRTFALSEAARPNLEIVKLFTSKALSHTLAYPENGAVPVGAVWVGFWTHNTANSIDVDWSADVQYYDS